MVQLEDLSIDLQYTNISLLKQLAIAEAQESFHAYRRYLHPDLLINWWQRELCRVMQQFKEDWEAGKRPKLLIESPPQHGKTFCVVDFITWMAGLHPECKTIYASFSDRLGVRANLMCQRTFDTDRYQTIFPETRISQPGANGGLRNQDMLEYIGHEGSFRNTTVRGSITGESLSLGCIDDPLKGREEAGSELIRNKTWDWFTDDFFTRFSDNAGLLCIATRWHLDDPLGRLRQTLGASVQVYSYPAIAVHDEPNRKTGEPLCPALKSLDFLLERKRTMASANWEALYQQNPQIPGGMLIHGASFPRYTVLPVLTGRTIYGDTAQKTAERNDYSVFECWGLGVDHKLYLLDLIRGKWEAPELKRRAIDFWNKHAAMDKVFLGGLRMLKVEDKSSGTGLIQEIKTDGKIPVQGIERSKDKYTRWLDVAGYVESGYVLLPADAPFTSDFLAECEAFTADDSHLFDDQIDPMMDAIMDNLASANVVKLWENIL
jgi:predicted phage terminase large subunit-like protein